MPSADVQRMLFKVQHADTARALRAQGQWERAEHEWFNILGAWPDDRRIYYDLGLTQLFMGNWGGSVDSLRRAVELGSEEAAFVLKCIYARDFRDALPSDWRESNWWRRLYDGLVELSRTAAEQGSIEARVLLETMLDYPVPENVVEAWGKSFWATGDSQLTGAKWEDALVFQCVTIAKLVGISVYADERYRATTPMYGRPLRQPASESLPRLNGILESTWILTPANRSSFELKGRFPKWLTNRRSKGGIWSDESWKSPSLSADWLLQVAGELTNRWRTPLAPLGNVVKSLSEMLWDTGMPIYRYTRGNNGTLELKALSLIKTWQRKPVESITWEDITEKLRFGKNLD